MDSSFEDVGGFTAGVAQRAGLGAPAEIADALAAGITAGEVAWRATPALPGQVALNLRIGRYFIRDEDLPVIETLSAVATAIATSLATGGATAVTLIPAIGGLATLAWNLWRRGALLTPDQLRLYGAMRLEGPCSLDRLVTLAAALGIVPADAAKVRSLLAGLAEMETRNGTQVPAAAVDDAGLWRARAL